MPWTAHKKVYRKATGRLVRKVQRKLLLSFLLCKLFCRKTYAIL